MKQLLTRVDKIIIMCKNIQQTTALYSQGLGLKVYLQSDTFVQLKDASNFSIYLKQSTLQPSHLTKGYSPMLSLKVDDFDKTYQKLKKYQLLIDGGVDQCQFGKLMTFVGMEGELITINDFTTMEQQQKLNESNQQTLQTDKQTQQIKRLLRKINI